MSHSRKYFLHKNSKTAPFAMIFDREGDIIMKNLSILIYWQFTSNGYRQGVFSSFQYIHLTDFYAYFIFLHRENAPNFLKF